MGTSSVQGDRLGGIRPTGGKVLAILNAQVVCSWFYFPPHPTHALAAQGDIQGYGTGKDGVFDTTGDSSG